MTLRLNQVMHPRTAARLAAMALTISIALPRANAQSSAATRVTVETGALQGTAVDGVISFKGIPFAAPPVGPLRWRAPQPAARWDGVRDASAYGHDCMQLPFPSDAAPLGTPPAEDCLYANVWRPANGATRLPVLVWIYGGGFLNGGASPPTYAGTEIARQGVLFFSFNYRLGRFGTFGHPQLTAAHADDGARANFNHLDQIAALRWVQRNIAAFGGDPANVTIVGESAGGGSVHTLVTSPQTAGLFARAVVQSGGGGDNVVGGSTLAALDSLGVAFAETKGIQANDPQALAKLRALPPDAIVDGLNLSAFFSPGPPAATLKTMGRLAPDGRFVADAAKAYTSGAFRRVPMMIGATSDDIGGKTGYMTVGARNASRLVSSYGLPVWYYRFSYVATSVRTPATRGAGHASDIPFFFHTEGVKYGAGTTATDRAVGKTISAYLVNFVKTGDPNGAGLTQWPRYDAKTDAMIDFSADGKAVAGPDPWKKDIDATSPSSRP